MHLRDILVSIILGLIANFIYDIICKNDENNAKTLLKKDRSCNSCLFLCILYISFFTLSLYELKI